MHTINECNKVTIAGGRGIKNADASAIEQVGEDGRVDGDDEGGKGWELGGSPV